MNYREVNTRNAVRLQGQAGVYRVASELLLRGFNPQFPAVDCGYDLSVEGGVRVQVKSGHLRMNSKVYPQGAYWFKLTRGPVAQGNHRVRRRAPRVFSQECDFVVFWGIEQQRFWIVPSAVLDNKSLVVLGPDIGWKSGELEEIRRLHGEGLRQEDIAERLGMSQMTVSRRLRGLFTEPCESRSLTYQVRQGEGRWDLIESYVDLLTGAVAAASIPEVANTEGKGD